ncbi:MAG: M48 family metalloprotease [Leptolyngbyaceae cyanobacterium]
MTFKFISDSRYRKPILFMIVGFWVAIALNIFIGPLVSPAAHSQVPAAPLVAQNVFAPSQFQTLSEGDRFYREGDTNTAETLYRQVKPPFSNQGGEAISSVLIYEPDNLPPAGQVYWRNGQQGLDDNLETLIFESLPRLVENYPEFIPGHLALAQAYQAFEQPEESLAVLERATALYPDVPDLLRAQMRALADDEQYLEASITARQFTLIYPDYPQAPEFTQLAEEYAESHRKKVRRDLLVQQIGGTLLGALQGVLTDNWSSGLSGLQTLLLLSNSESKVGAKFAEEYRQQLTLVDDPDVVGYVEELGRQLEPLMGRDDFEYEYYVVQDNNLNASAFPGGKIFVNTGAILNTRSEAELVGLMGHELAHAALSHGYQRLSRGIVLNSLQNVIPFGDVVTNLVASEYSRAHEKQADILGTRVLSLSGYAADGLRNLMATLRELSGDRATSLFASHPAPASRVRYLERLIQENGYNRYAFEGVDRHKQIQNILQGLEPDEGLPIANSGGGQSLGTGGSGARPQPEAPVQQSDQIAAAGDRPDVSLTREGVTISLEAFSLRSTTVSARIVIQNNSDRPFGFVPIFTRVVDVDETRFASNIAFETAGGDVLVPPGETLSGTLSVFGGDRPTALTDEMFLVITEGTSGGRLFRIGF